MLNFNFAFSSAFSCFVALCTVLLRGVSLFKQGSGNLTWIVISLLILMDSMEGTKALVRSGRTRQPTMIYTPSKTLVLEFTPAPYEVLKQNVMSFYEQSNENRTRVDENKNRVDESISVFDGKDGKKRNQLFLVNLYNTTSRVTVNGKC